MAMERSRAGSGRGVVASGMPVDREFVLTRVFTAPRELVFAAWTKAEHFARWFGPRGFGIPACAMDAWPGGAIRFCMGAPGAEYWHEGVFREVVEPERIVFTLRFTDGRGNPVPHPNFPGWPLEAEFHQTVTFAERGGATEVTVRQVIVPPEAAAHEAFEIERPLARQGWSQSFERLDELLAHLRG